MDLDEIDYRERDFKLRADEFRQRDRHHEDQRKAVYLTGVATFVGILVTVFVATATILAQNRQFDASLRTNEYNGIVAGLASDAIAVQDSSMRRLVDYVQNEDNYDSEDLQEQGYRNAMQTLTVFIVDESTRSPGTGLSSYQDPQPIIVPRAMSHLRVLTQDKLGAATIDFAGADLHGASLPGFAPLAHVWAPGADFRRASLDGLNLEADGSPSTLKSAFFTCSSLVSAKFGNAALDGADLTGADLRNADLSQVTGLTREQLNGAWIGPATRLPLGLPEKPQVGWRGTDPDRCYDMVNDMTGMRGSQGYYSKLPCPTSEAAAKSMHLKPAWRLPLSDLVGACRLRAGMSRTEVTPQPGS